MSGDARDATTPVDGALSTRGGLSVAKGAMVGGRLRVFDNTDAGTAGGGALAVVGGRALRSSPLELNLTVLIAYKCTLTHSLQSRSWRSLQFLLNFSIFLRNSLNSVSGLVSNVSRSTNQNCPFRKSHRPTRRKSGRVTILE